MVIHDTECPYWDQVSLTNTNPTRCFCKHALVWLLVRFFHVVFHVMSCFFHVVWLRFNHCTTCGHDSGLVKFELARLSRPGITWRWMLWNDTHVITIACHHWVCISTTRHNMQKCNYVMAILSLCACERFATHDMIKTHTTCAHKNTSSDHDLHNMKKAHHEKHGGKGFSHSARF